MAKADVAHLRNMKYVKNCDFSMACFFIKLTRLPILLMCANPPVEMLAHMLKVSEGLASHQTEADWSRQTEPTHAQSTVQRLAIFPFLLFSDLTFPPAPHSNSISFFTLLLPCAPQCCSLHLFFKLFFPKELFLIMSQSAGWRDSCREEMGCTVDGTCWLTLLVAVMGITTGLLKWLLLHYSELVTEQ